MNFNEEGKIIFGSAPIGIKQYGFQSNKPLTDLNSFFKNLQDSGVFDIDTAPNYGNIENEIGKFHLQNNSEFRIWTKVSDLEKKSQLNTDKILVSVKESLEKTKCNKLYALYLHQNDIFIMSDKFVQAGLKLVKEDNLTSLVGVSIYSEEELRFSLALDIIDIIQIPVNAANTYLYNIAKENNVHNKRIIGRSLLLQGTMLNIESIKNNFNFRNDILTQVNALKKLSIKYNYDYVKMILSYIGSLNGLSNFILSSRNYENFKKLVKYVDYVLPRNLKLEIDNISNKNEKWSNPRNWIFYR